MSTIASLLFAVAVSADPPPTLQTAIGLPGGGEVELVAIGNADDDWWRPTGEVIDSPLLYPEPHRPNDSFGVKSGDRREWFHFIVRMSSIPENQDVRIDPSISRAKPGIGTGITFWSRKVVDANGDLVGGFVSITILSNPASMPGDTLQLRISTAFGEWTQVVRAPAIVIPAGQEFTRIGDQDTPDPVVETQVVNLQASKRLIVYRNKVKREAIRAKLHYSNGDVEVQPSETRHNSETYFRLEDWKPVARDPNDLDFVTFETRSLQVSKLEGIPIYSVGQLAAEQKRREQLPLFIGLGVAGLLSIVAVSWFVVVATRNRTTPDLD